MADRFASRIYSLKNKLGDRMIKQLLNLVIAKYRVLPRPIIVNYSMAESTGAKVDQANPACVVCVQLGYPSRQD